MATRSKQDSTDEKERGRQSIMDYRYLKAFILTAKYASFSKAAEELKIAQSAVSRQIKLLEESVGEELIIRSSKKVLLTYKGQELFVAAQQFDQVSHDIFAKEDKRDLRIGLLQGLLKNWFNPILVKYLKRHSRNLHIHLGEQHDLKKGLESGQYDLIFSTENIQSDLISSLKLFDERLVLIAREEVDRKRLHEYRWIVYGEDDNIYKISKKVSDSIVQVESLNTIIDLVKNNIGIAVVPDHILKKRDDLVVQNMPGLEKSEIFMSTLSYKTMPGYIRELSDIVAQNIHQTH